MIKTIGLEGLVSRLDYGVSRLNNRKVAGTLCCDYVDKLIYSDRFPVEPVKLGFYVSTADKLSLGNYGKRFVRRYLKHSDVIEFGELIRIIRSGDKPEHYKVLSPNIKPPKKIINRLKRKYSLYSKIKYGSALTTAAREVARANGIFIESGGRY